MRFRPRFGSTLKRLLPGIGVERWLLLLFGGITIVTLGVGYVLVVVYRAWTFPSAIYYLTPQSIPRIWRELLLGVAGVAAITMAILRPSGSLLSAFRALGQSSLAEIIYNHGPCVGRSTVVVVGGGTGLSALLRRRRSIQIASPLSSPWRTTAVVPAVCDVVWDYCLMEQSRSGKRHSISTGVCLGRLLCYHRTSVRPRLVFGTSQISGHGR
jgi:hypothetical protein